MKALTLLSLVGFPLLFTSCNAVKGLGEDISGSAAWTQDKITGDSSTRSSDAQYVQNPPKFQKAN